MKTLVAVLGILCLSTPAFSEHLDPKHSPEPKRPTNDYARPVRRQAWVSVSVPPPEGKKVIFVCPLWRWDEAKVSWLNKYINEEDHILWEGSNEDKSTKPA